jgi:DNA-binding transcriptional LysR family regulator
MLLTEAGRTFLKEARSILSQSQRAVQLAQAASRGEAGHLDIAYSVEGFEPVLLRVIRLFRQLFPMVELGIRELQYHQQVHELINRRIDLGYVGIRFPELESELVTTNRAFSAEQHRLKRRKLRALARRPFMSSVRFNFSIFASRGMEESWCERRHSFL